MLKYVTDSFKENIQQKKKNPFLGTVILVWVFENHQNFYKLFWGYSISFEKKLQCLDSIFNLTSFFRISFFAFLVLIGTYILLSISRFIVDFFEKIVLNFIVGIIDKKAIIEKTIYDHLKKQNEDTQHTLEKSNEELLVVKEEFTDIKKKYEDSKKEVESLHKQTATLQGELYEKNKRFRNVLSMISFIEKFTQDFQVSPYNETKDDEILINMIETQGRIDFWETLIFTFTPQGRQNKNYLDLSEISKVSFFKEADLIRPVEGVEMGKAYFEFTPRGRQFLIYYKRRLYNNKF